VTLDNAMLAGRNVNVDPSAVGTIENDDQAKISITNVQDEEGYSGITRFTSTAWPL